MRFFMKKRFHYLDILKCIAIFSVCFYHFSAVSVDLSGGFSRAVLVNRWFYTLNSICVPVFMMVNGALLLSRPLNIRKHYRSLALFCAVYWLWRVITFVLLGAAAGYDFSALGAGDVINHLVLMKDFGSPLLVDHFWFIIMYIRIQLILPLLHCVFNMERKDSAISCAVIMAVLWISCFAVKDYSLVAAALPAAFCALFTDSLTAYSPFTGIYGTMIFFFLLGGIIVRYADRSRKIHPAVYAFVFAAAAAVQTVVYMVEHITLGAGSDLVFGRYNTTTNIVMCVSLFMLAYRCEGIFEKHPKVFAPFETAGQNTISIFYLHWLAGKLVLPMLDIPDGYIVSVITIALMVAVCTAVSIVCRNIPVVKYMFGVVPAAKSGKNTAGEKAVKV